MYMHTMYEETATTGAALAKRPARFVYRQQLLQQRSSESYRSRESSCDTSSMESEVRSLRQEVARTQDSLRAATRRCRELVRELDGLGAEQERERLLRDQQLSRILRALLVLESRLKQEQKSIRQLLCEKDNVIRNQQLEIASLRRYTKSYIKGQRRDQGCCGSDVDAPKDGSNDTPSSLESSDFQEHDSGLSKDIQKLKCEIITKLNEGLDSSHHHHHHANTNIRKTHSFAGSDISKTSLTSSENTDASIITTTTDGSPSLLSTEGFCEGESSDVSPGSTLNKGSSSRCTPTIVTTDSENEVTMVLLEDGQLQSGQQKAGIARSESKDDGMDCNYASDEDEDEPIYENANLDENNKRNLLTTDDDCSNNNLQMSSRITRLDAEDQNESSGNWYSDPDEDRLNDEMLRHSVYRPNSNHNSVLECVNQILLRDMEDDENILSVPRRFKHRGKIVRFQPARLSDIESVGSEMERRNSEEPPHTTVSSGDARAAPNAIEVMDKETQDGNDNEAESSIDGFEATNSEDEFGMRIVPVMDPESGLEEDVDDSKARPIVIIEPCVKVEESLNNSNILRSLTKNNSKPSSPTSLRMERIEEKTCLQMSGKGLTIAKNLDYEDIESLPEIISPTPKVPPALPPKPQFRNNTLILKKIPSPSFLIDETSRKKQQNVDPTRTPTRSIFGLGGKNPLMTPTSVRSLRFDDIPKKNNNIGNDETSSFWKNRFNNVRSSFTLHKSNNDLSRSSPEPRNHLPKVTNIVRHFEEFKIEGGNELSNEPPKRPTSQPPAEFEVDEYDIQQNFEEFNLDDCDLCDDPNRPEADGSETYTGLNSNSGTMTSLISNDNSAQVKHAENNNTLLSSNNGQQQLNNGNSVNYDNFLEATGLSNKSILTPSRLLSNHKSMLKPKDVKYKSKIKATAVLERHGISLNSVPGSSTTHTKHWTGPFV